MDKFREQAIEENALFALSQSGVDKNDVEWEHTRYYQESLGLLPLSPADAAYNAGRLSPNPPKEGVGLAS